MRRSVLALALCTELRSVHAFVSQHARARGMASFEAKKRGGGKPSPEEIARRRAEAAANKAAAPPKPAPAPAPAKKERDPGAELAALRAFALGGGVELVDIGTNLQTRGSYADVARQLRRAAEAGVTRVVLTGCDVAGARKGRRLAERWALEEGGGGDDDDNGGGSAAACRVYFTAGVHPHDATKWDAQTAEAIRELARSPACVSLGECGLDYDRMFSPRDTQLRVFEEQCALAAELGRPLFVHVRERDADKGEPLGAYADALAILAKFDGGGGLPAARVCVHCFTGNEAELAPLLERGVCVGFTGFVGIAKRAGATIAALRALGVARRVAPLSEGGRVLIETDAPFMSPDKQFLPTATAKAMGLRGGKNEPCVMPAVARALAAALGDGAPSPEEVGRATTAAAIEFFDLHAADERIARWRAECAAAGVTASVDDDEDVDTPSSPADA